VVSVALGVSSSAAADERFRVTGRVEAQTRRTDGRFALKATAGATCAPFPDALFRDEFE
jgi:hypothetical protein